MNSSGEIRLIPLTAWNNYHAWPSQGGLRHLVHQCQENGFDKVIRRAGRRILINEKAFFEWMETQGKWKPRPLRKK